jgi:UDP-2,3-diacylglucosamine pyrophosphatase LpxH
VIVIVSDLHLTDGSSGETIKEGAFRVFRERLRDLVYDASKRADGRYEPIRQLDVILLGDILDIIRSDQWCAAPPEVRPWGNVDDPRVQEKVRTITEAILEHNAGSIAILRSLSQEKVITVPRATPEGKVAVASRDPKAAERAPVQIRLHYMIGNHDWMYHLPGEPYGKIREFIRRELGLANSPGPFPHDPSESSVIMQLYRDHRIFARHGDIYDSMNFEQTRDASSLGDAVVIELLNRFPELVVSRLGSGLSDDCRQGLKELDNVRPLQIVPVWLDGLLKNTCTADQSKEIKSIWNTQARNFLGTDFVKKQRGHFLFKLGLRFSRNFSLSTLSRLMLRFKKRMQSHPSFAPCALTETAFRDGSAEFLVYGHTHWYEVVPLRAAPSDQGLLKQTYINSGTWRAVHELGRFDPRQEQFVGYHVMTYLAFFRDDERKGRSFECWSGALEE